MSITRCSVLVFVALGACSLPHARGRDLPTPGEDSATVDAMTVDDQRLMPDSDVDASAADSTLDDAIDDVVADQSDAVSTSETAVEAAVDASSMDAAPDVTADGAAPSDAGADVMVDVPRDAGCTAGTADCGDGLCRPILDTIVTCVEATRDGVHVLTIGGTNFCAYCQQFGAGSRWTMALKANGTDTSGPPPQRFSYDSPLWTNTDTWLEHNVDRDQRETKTRAFFALPFREVLIEMNTGGTVRSLRGALAGGTVPPVPSLRAVFMGGNNAYPSAFSVNRWLESVPDARLQDSCQRVGFNVRANEAGSARVRMGAIGNENWWPNECDTHDSWVGVGGVRETSDPSLSFSAGNVARYHGDNNRTIRSHATVWVRE